MTEAPVTSPPAQDSGRSGSPYAKPWWIASALLVAVIVALGVWLVVLPPVARSPARSPARAAAPSAVDRLPASRCGLAGADQTPPAVTPPGTRWVLVGTMAAPTDPHIGPAAHTGGLPTCYAPTPLGALYAAANFLAVTSLPGQRIPAATVLAAPGPGRDAALTQLGCNDTNPATVCSGGTTTGVQLAGFVFTGYLPAVSASLELAVTTPTGGYAHFPISLVFTGGDWLVQLPATGSPYTVAATLPGLAGYVAWSGA